MRKIRGIWFYGMSNSGKSFASRYIKKKNKKNNVILDGDEIRKYVSFDLGYTLKDRKTQILRIFGLAKILINSNVFPIISTVYMSRSLSNKLKKEKILLIEIIRNKKEIFKKRLYRSKKNLVGVDIKQQKIDSLKINNTGDKKFCSNINKLVF